MVPIKKLFTASIPFLLVIITLGIYISATTRVASAAINDCLSLSGNLIQNCSFEDKNPLPKGYINHSTGAVVFTPGYSGLSNWNIISPISNSNVGYFPAGFPSPSGTKMVDLSGFVDKANPKMNGEQAGSGVEQLVTGLEPGQIYQLHFSQAYLAPFASQITVLIDGKKQGTYDVNASTAGAVTIGGVVWKDQGLTFTASSSNTSIRFINSLGQPGGAITIFGSAIDNVSLVLDKAPEIKLSTPSAQVMGPFQVTITPTESIVGLTLADFKINNGVLSNLSGSGSGPYTVTVTPKEFGTVAMVIPEGTVTDLANNSNKQSNELSVSYIKSEVVTPPIKTPDNCQPIVSDTPREVKNRRCIPTTTTPTPIKGLEVSIISNNPTNHNYATIGNVITLNYTLPTIPTINKVTVGLQKVVPVCMTNRSLYICSAAIIVTEDIPTRDGLVTFTISTDDMGRNAITATTDKTYVIVDRKNKIIPLIKEEIPDTTPPVTPSDPCGGKKSCSETTNIGTPVNPTPSTPSTPTGSGPTKPITFTFPTSDGGTTITTTVPVSSPVAAVVSTTSNSNACTPRFKQYLILGDVDGKKGIKEVSNIQSFLKDYLGIKFPTPGVFDQTTFKAVFTFQAGYSSQIISPWRIGGPTGWWYQSTRSYANYVTGCSEGIIRLDNGTRMLDGVVLDN